MRTTITLDEDVARQLVDLQRERGISFKEAVNATLRQGLRRPATTRRFRQKTYPMGLRPGIDLDKASHIAAELEDEAIIEKLRLGK